MRTPPPMVSRACAMFLGTTARTAEQLALGSRTAVYRTGLHDGRSVIVKLYAHTARRNAVTEAAAIRAAAATVPVPEVLGCGTTSSEGGTALITSDLGGCTLGSAVRASTITRSQALRDLGGLLARLHQAPIAHPAPSRPFHDAVSSLSRRCPSDLLNVIGPTLALIADAPESTPLVWCHGDVHFDNVVLAGPQDARHLVDFTDAAPGHRESDVAHALVMATTHAPQDRLALTGAYSLVLDDALLSAWAVFQTVRCWAYAVHHEDRALWSSRLASLTRQSPQLFRTPRKERTPR
ncbi:phosphotransferase family protein [Streptomyces sp. H39-S7]|uniref:phosphotransferase family protein n=1 Tax=Streptomyces sp. H39-S7 TaxID=3004357 RepID=UPI0022B05D1A|nr:aminoglycoside phosphotransferase family protein [Streptomyces sp. H39-S7]MCZ4117918.1 aminoglycoside phosphotransferase family protein [Streptomyces sp. H39-S7]